MKISIIVPVYKAEATEAEEKKAVNKGKKIVVESEGLDPTGLEEVKRCIDFLKAQE